jgi:nucleotide-binding universal stress UspA family protein
MYRRVLVPLDGSQHALAAIEPARVLAAGFGCPVQLVHVAPEGQQLPDLPDGTEVLTGDDVAGALVEAAAGDPGSVVCISSRGRGAVSELVLGSVARQLVASSDRPVVVVGPACERPVPTGWSGQLVVALDGSDLATEMVAEAARWARALDASLRLLHVVAPPSDPWWRPESSVSANLLADELDRLARELGEQGVLAHPVVVPDPNPVAGIVRQAAPRKADLVMMSTHGRTGLARMVLGSVSAQVVATCPVPVVLARPHELERP